ncbi:MAG: hypothetical protein ACQEW8_15175 [Actinomycetota bacterium]
MGSTQPKLGSVLQRGDADPERAQAVCEVLGVERPPRTATGEEPCVGVLVGAEIELLPDEHGDRLRQPEWAAPGENVDGIPFGAELTATSDSAHASSAFCGKPNRPSNSAVTVILHSS